MKAVVVDDHPMCRAATAMALRVVDPDVEAVEAASLEEALALADGAALVTLDLGLPDNRGVLGLAALVAAHPNVPVLVISGAGNPAVERQVARMGARGFLHKAAPISEMVAAIRRVLAGETWFSVDPADDGDDAFTRLATLTPAQSRVLGAMESGRLNKQIAYDLGLSEITIKAHVKAILRKLAVPNRTQAILMLREAQA